MTEVQFPEVFEHLINEGSLTGTIATTFNFVGLKEINKGTKIIIERWDFPERQPTTTEIETIENSQAFIDYLADRDSIKRKQSAKDALDNINDDTKQLFQAFAEVLLDIHNEERQRHGLSLRTLTQLKNSIKSKL